MRRRYLVLQRWSLDRVLLCESPLRGLFARPAPSDADAVVVLACCGVGGNQVVQQLGKHPAEMCCGSDAGNLSGGCLIEFCCLVIMQSHIGTIRFIGLLMIRISRGRKIFRCIMLPRIGL